MQMTSPENIRRDLLSLGIDDASVNTWLETAAMLPAGEDEKPFETPTTLWWQDQKQFDAICEEVAFAPAIRSALSDACQTITREAPAWVTMIALADRFYRSVDGKLCYPAVARPGPPASKWPKLSPLYRALVYFTGLPWMIKAHRDLGIDPAITRDTADGIAVWMEAYHQKHGQWGTADGGGWFINHLLLRIFKIGRLEFEKTTFNLPCTVLINAQGQPAAVFNADQLIRSDGLIACADHGSALNAPDNWTTTFTQTDDAITGHVVNNRGRVQKQTQTFPLSEWKIIAQKGTPSLGVHIPARGKLDTAACLDAFARAPRFFEKHYPGNPATIITCVSWLMDPQLADLEDGRSNLGRFTQLWEPVPVKNAHDKQMFERVFDNQTDLAKLPRDTSLRRNIIAFMEQGGHWRCYGGYRNIPQD